MMLGDPLPWLDLYPLECVAIAGALVMAIARWQAARYRRRVAVGALAVSVSAAIVLLVAGMRWQMVPVLAAMVLALPSVVPAVLPPRERTPGRSPRWLAAPATVVLVGMTVGGAAAGWALPVPTFLAPTGRYAVGTTTVQWTDADRPETATAAPNDRRTVVAQLWYPAASGEGERAPYLGRTPEESKIVAEGLASYTGLPGFMLDGLAHARTAAFLDAEPVAGGTRFPVVLFSPGLGGARGQNTMWATEIASRGYVVVALDHPYDSAAVVLADGTVIHTRVTATGDDDRDRANAVRWTTVRAQDLSFVLTRLGTSRFADVLDLDHVAVTGHSLGGGAALLAARLDHRFDAVVDLDGFPYAAATKPFPQPVLVVNHPLAEDESTDFLATADGVLDLAGAGYRVEMPNTAHLTFTDAPLWLPPLPSVVGMLGRYQGPELTAEITALFLDHELRGQGSEPGLRGALSAYGSVDHVKAGSPGG
ncbi:alpha/beta hydrolase family protein [Actinophytocola sp.]|uniref:alpha/beta hydrolase family protein n=1 Tax=Actinophytocola sp. TaxID=1872138 RepID=UPI00389AC008